MHCRPRGQRPSSSELGGAASDPLATGAVAAGGAAELLEEDDAESRGGELAVELGAVGAEGAVAVADDPRFAGSTVAAAKRSLGDGQRKIGRASCRERE